MTGRLVFGEDGSASEVADLPRSLTALRGLGGRAFSMQPGYVYYVDMVTQKRVLVRCEHATSPVRCPAVAFLLFRMLLALLPVSAHFLHNPAGYVRNSVQSDSCACAKKLGPKRANACRIAVRCADAVFQCFAR